MCDSGMAQGLIELKHHYSARFWDLDSNCWEENFLCCYEGSVKLLVTILLLQGDSLPKNRVNIKGSCFEKWGIIHIDAHMYTSLSRERPSPGLCSWIQTSLEQKLLCHKPINSPFCLVGLIWVSTLQPSESLTSPVGQKPGLVNEWMKSSRSKEGTNPLITNSTQETFTEHLLSIWSNSPDAKIN